MTDKRHRSHAIERHRPDRPQSAPSPPPAAASLRKLKPQPRQQQGRPFVHPSRFLSRVPCSSQWLQTHRTQGWREKSGMSKRRFQACFLEDDFSSPGKNTRTIYEFYSTDSIVSRLKITEQSSITIGLIHPPGAYQNEVVHPMVSPRGMGWSTQWCRHGDGLVHPVVSPRGMAGPPSGVATGDGLVHPVVSHGGMGWSEPPSNVSTLILDVENSANHSIYIVAVHFVFLLSGSPAMSKSCESRVNRVNIRFAVETALCTVV